tara:strand:+ start:674 stop:781 length:108 start_codon:yes stop_codon:yes gene_type:complete
MASVVVSGEERVEPVEELVEEQVELVGRVEDQHQK